MIKPAIITVGYNRPDSMLRLLESLSRADYPFDDIDLIISIDNCATSETVAKVAEAFEWTHGNKIVRHFPERQGLRRHIIQCGDLSEKYGAVIVLEDDLVVSPSFYYYTYQAVNEYCHNEKVAGIALYSHSWNGYANTEFIPVKNEYDVFFGQFGISWGQCWTDEQWKKFKAFYLENEDKLPRFNPALPDRVLKWSPQSWGKYFISYIVAKDKYFVVPYTSMTTNFSEVGQHCKLVDASHQVSLLEGVKKNYEFPAFESAIKYDIFFERIFDDEYRICGIPASEICLDLNRIKPQPLGKKYLLTTRALRLEKVASFGLSMHPIDNNIVHKVSGEGIYLYKCPEEELNLAVNAKKMTHSHWKYELYGYHWQLLLCAGVSGLLGGIKGRIKRMFRIK